MVDRKKYKVNMPTKELMEDMYELDILDIAEGYEEKISYLVKGDTLYGFMDHLRFLNDLKSYIIEEGYNIGIKYNNGIWTCTTYTMIEDQKVDYVSGGNEYSVVLAIAERVLRSEYGEGVFGKS